MTEHDSRRYRPPGHQELDNLGHLQLVEGSRVLDDVGSDLVRILKKLTSDVERFDSIVVLQRTMLEQRSGHVGAFDDDELSRQSERISLEAAAMVACARQALEQLSRLAEPTKSRTLHAPHRSRPHGLRKDRPTD